MALTNIPGVQDDKARVMAFKLRQPGFMKSFEGFWRMEEAPGDEKVSSCKRNRTSLSIQRWKQFLAIWHGINNCIHWQP